MHVNHVGNNSWQGARYQKLMDDTEAKDGFFCIVGLFLIIYTSMGIILLMPCSLTKETNIKSIKNTLNF